MMKKTLLILLGLSVLAQADFTRDNTTGIVTDSTTTLQWQDDVVGSTMVWEAAINHCETLNLGTYTDWRLPNFNELYYIADRTKRNPAMSSVFQSVVSDYYWSSTAVVDDEYGAWGVDFISGNGIRYVKSYGNYVRCVRDGQ